MADKCIGKLYLDIGQVKKDIEDVNKFLSQIGANINLEDKLSQKISAALGKLVKEAKRAGEEAQKAISQGLSADINVSVYEKMQQKVLAAENKMRAEADKTIAKQEERAEREAAAADKLYSQLPPEQGSELKALWEEFDGMETVDAKYAACLDRIQPLLHNTLTEGHTWQNNGAVRSQVEARAGIVKEFMPEVYAWIDKNLDRGVELGWIKDI